MPLPFDHATMTSNGLHANGSADAARGNGVMPDVQASPDDRRVAIDRVGVKDVVYPLRLRVPGGGERGTVAKINMYVALPHDRKGTHMSRFLEVLNERAAGAIGLEDVSALTEEIRDRLDAETARLEVSFTYFIEKPAPVTGQVGLVDYEVTLACEAGATGTDFVLGVAAPATSLCPCSKEISEYGAHNQRCRIAAKVRTSAPITIEELVGILEDAASHPVYAVLKRPDEKFVTEKAFENPKFVEDIVRDLARGLERDGRVRWFEIDSENFESIHSHNAYASITRTLDRG